MVRAVFGRGNSRFDMKSHSRTPADLRNMFGANLRVLSRGYSSISELSRQLGINRTQFNRYLSGESFPRPDVLDRICRFFDVDARILLEPVDSLRGGCDDILNGDYLSEFLGRGCQDIPEDYFPSGFYRFSRRSFLSSDRFIIGLVRVFRDGPTTYIRGFEAKEAMRQQGLSVSAASREFRGYVTRQDDGVVAVIARRGSISCSFNYLSRVASFENNYWLGYVTRTVAESVTGSRAERMVYEHLGRHRGNIFDAARCAGLVTEDALLPYHRRLLRTEDPFR